MAQFDVYRNPHTKSRSSTPFLLDIQINLLRESDRRLVVPLVKKSEIRLIREVHPVFAAGPRRCLNRTIRLEARLDNATSAR